MEKIIAYCGIVCSDCPAYVATQANDRAALEKMAADAHEQYGQPDITAESAMCDGCLAGPHKSGYCAQCNIRACGVEHGGANCAHCAEYPCEKLQSFWAMAPAAKETLEQIRLTL